MASDSPAQPGGPDGNDGIMEVCGKAYTGFPTSLPQSPGKPDGFTTFPPPFHPFSYHYIHPVAQNFPIWKTRLSLLDCLEYPGTVKNTLSSRFKPQYREIKSSTAQNTPAMPIIPRRCDKRGIVQNQRRVGVQGEPLRGRAEPYFLLIFQGENDI